MIYTQRIFWPSYNTPEKLERLLQFLQNHRPICDEISFFTEGDGQDWRFLPPDEVERRAAFLTEAVRQTREAGLVPVINVLNTMGHCDEGGEAAPVVPWQGIVGTDGAVAKQCSCPFDEQFLEYCRFKYEQFARCGAEKIWIDDDVRLNNHSPVGWGCFCALCLDDFKARAGREYSRDELVAALGEDKAIRAAWRERNHEVMMGVLRACTEGVKSGAGEQSIEIGFMTCDISDLHDWRADASEIFEQLTEITGGAGWLRPGGGFWNDNAPREVLSKIHRVGNSVDGLPINVRATHEVENYPFIQGGKSAAMTGLECLLVTLATRLDGIMFDVFDHAGNDPQAFDQWAGDLADWRPLWDEAARLVQNTTPVGWRPFYSLDHFVNHSINHTDAMRFLHYQQPLALQPAGLPFTSFAEGAEGHMISGITARGLSLQDMKTLLQKPLMMDAESAQCFLDAGLGAQIGIESIVAHYEGITEHFTDHTLNGEYSLYRRAVTMKYFGMASHALRALPSSEVLSELRNSEGAKLGDALTLHRSPEGVPVAVIGHLPWDFLLSPQRMAQLQNLSDAMLQREYSLGINRPVVQWRRRDAESGQEITILFNAGFDAARDVCVRGAGELQLSTPGVEVQPDGAGLRITLPAWSVAVVG